MSKDTNQHLLFNICLYGIQNISRKWKKNAYGDQSLFAFLLFTQFESDNTDENDFDLILKLIQTQRQ